MKKPVFLRNILLLSLLLISASAGGNQAGTDSFDNWNKAYEYLQTGDCGMALPWLLKAESSGEKTHWIYNNLVNCLLKDRKTEEALAFAKKGMERFPDEIVMRDTLIWALQSSGWSLIGNKKYYEAENRFKEALVLDEKNAETLNGYGVALRESGDISKLAYSVDVLEQAFVLSPDKDYIFHNMWYAYSKLLTTAAADGDFETLEKQIKRLNSHYILNKKQYNKYNIGHDSIDDLSASAYGVCGIDPQPGIDSDKCVTSLESMVAEYPDNYRLKFILGCAYTNNGNAAKGYLYREQAWADYLKIRKPVFAEIFLSFPLRGRILSIKYQAPVPKSHSGLWRNAVDYIVVNKEGANISYGQKVYAPADGEITFISDGSPELSNLWLKMDNGYTVGLVHFRPGSFKVKKGQRVKSGDLLGELGIPDNAHLHMHIFNDQGATVPYKFKKFRSAEGKTISDNVPEPGKVFYFP
ncbi:MAG: peptidoglycan DD-metalloendopeptidase family protein [Spirochaetes bacterium]|nr:peptidoglycan DD-metalloendopeptidase family protein [Spirochaetota bacterium]